MGLARGMSRRQALRVMGAAVVGVSVAGSIRPRSARAAADCGSRMPWYPGCLVPVPADPPRGSLGIENSGCAPWGLLPSFSAVPFDFDCGSLGTCYTACGRDQSTCDYDFHLKMISTCHQDDQSTPAGQLAVMMCLGSATTNIALVQSQSEGSPGNFNMVQADRCDCCECPGGCPDGTSCCSQDCVDLSSDPGNCGACGNGCASDEACCNSTCTQIGTADNCTECGDQCTCPPDSGTPVCYDDACNCF